MRLLAAVFLLGALLVGGPVSAQTIRGGNRNIACPYGGAGGADGCGGQISGANFQQSNWAATAIENGASANLANLTPTWNWPGVHYPVGYSAETLIPAHLYPTTGGHPECVYTATGGGGGGLAPLLTCAGASTFYDNPTLNNLDLTEGGTTCTQIILGSRYRGVISASNWRIGNSDSCSGVGQFLVYLKSAFMNPVTDFNLSNFSVDGYPSGLCTAVCTDTAGTLNSVIINVNARAMNVTLKYFDFHNLPNRLLATLQDNYEIKYFWGSNIATADVNNAGNHGEIVQAGYLTGDPAATNKASYGEFTMPTTAVANALNGPLFVNGTNAVDHTVQITPTVNNMLFIMNPTAGGLTVGGKASWDLERSYFPAAHFNNVYIYPAGSNTCGYGISASPITGATWANTAGGQTTLTITYGLSTQIAAGDSVVVAGTSASGGTGAGFNGTWTVVSVLSSPNRIVVTQASGSSPGTYSSGGTATYNNPGLVSPDYANIVNLYDMSTIGPYDNPLTPCAGHHS